MEFELFKRILLQALIQLVLFTLIPFLWWFQTERKEGKQGFFEWLGLKKPRGEGLAKFLLLGTLVYTLINALVLSFAGGIFPGWSGLEELGAWTLPAILINAVVTTSLTEELFFRGFLLKRFADKDEYKVANISQAMLFGLFSGIMYFGSMTFSQALFVSALLGFMGYALGWLNEKKGGGSLLLSWFIHATAGLLVGLGMMSGML